jgi:phosphopantothenoylcysteine decarboxylase/phosphopantothenate--cysteine ligase
MGMLDKKRILLGVTGSIAAYKSAFIVRELIKAGAEVKVILTPAAKDFVTPLTLGTLSKNEVLSNLVRDQEKGEWNNHVELGLWADFFLIAPASANTMAKMAHGEADNLLLTTYLSAKCPVFFAPAMDLDMHAHHANQQNIEALESRGNIHIPSQSGELASGLEGQGRLMEPEDIVQFMENYLMSKAPLKGKTVLITSGPTEEPIDPVRFIGNRSSGKMGAALAQVAVELGARVRIVSGPVALTYPKPANVIPVTTAEEMFKAVESEFDQSDIAIFAAAVADYRPRSVADEKMKKGSNTLNIELEPTRDILASFGPKKKPGQLVIGFALETENEIENARVKLEKKNCDLIVLNSLKNQGAGFAVDTNKVTFVSHNKTREFELKHKRDVASDIFNFLLEEYL